VRGIRPLVAVLFGGILSGGILAMLVPVPAVADDSTQTLRISPAKGAPMVSITAQYVYPQHSPASGRCPFNPVQFTWDGKVVASAAPTETGSDTETPTCTTVVTFTPPAGARASGTHKISGYGLLNGNPKFPQTDDFTITGGTPAASPTRTAVATNSPTPAPTMMATAAPTGMAAGMVDGMVAGTPVGGATGTLGPDGLMPASYPPASYPPLDTASPVVVAAPASGGGAFGTVAFTAGGALLLVGGGLIVTMMVRRRRLAKAADEPPDEPLDDGTVLFG
jgi:hypothetical protein